MKIVSKLYIGLFFIFAGINYLSAQNDSVSACSVSANVDLMSRYVWRGQQYGSGPSIQPGLSGTWKDFTLGFWGAYEVVASGSQETDFYLSKSMGAFTFALWDYWTYTDTEEPDYFNYSKNSTLHLLEAQVLISGNEKLPFNLLGSYFFYGTDPGKSIYLELQYTKSIRDMDMLLFAGYQAKGTFYAKNAGFVNLGCTFSKQIEITEKYSLPLLLSMVINPDVKRVQLVAGISL